MSLIVSRTNNYSDIYVQILQAELPLLEDKAMDQDLIGVCAFILQVLVHGGLLTCPPIGTPTKFCHYKRYARMLLT